MHRCTVFMVGDKVWRAGRTAPVMVIKAVPSPGVSVRAHGVPEPRYVVEWEVDGKRMTANLSESALVAVP